MRSLSGYRRERNYEYLLMYTGRLGGRERGKGEEPPATTTD